MTTAQQSYFHVIPRTPGAGQVRQRPRNFDPAVPNSGVVQNPGAATWQQAHAVGAPPPQYGYRVPSVAGAYEKPERQDPRANALAVTSAVLGAVALVALIAVIATLGSGFGWIAAVVGAVAVVFAVLGLRRVRSLGSGRLPGFLGLAAGDLALVGGVIATLVATLGA